MDQFKALMISKDGDGQSINWCEIGLNELMPGDVTVRVTHSTLNYKDGLALTGKAPVVRRWPMIPGIDFAGVVEQSEHDDFAAGDGVLINGWGLGETHFGGYAEYARVPGDWLIARPEGFTPAQCMAIGTAGFTAMLAVLALEEHKVAPVAGPVLVTGAAGGVGSVAVSLLSGLGYAVQAATGRAEEAGYLRELGATEVIDRRELSEPGRPLGKERWAGAIDVAGSHTLVNALAQVRYGGCVAACGLAQGMDLPASVAPFILRGVTLAGIDSVMANKPRRIEAWTRLARDLDTAKLDRMTQTHPIADVEKLAGRILKGEIRGRTVFELE